MTYLELCNIVKDKAGIAGPDISDVTSTTPKINRLICDWVREAWIEIQTDKFLRTHFLYKSNQQISCEAKGMLYEFTYNDFALNAEITFNFDRFFVWSNFPDIPQKTYKLIKQKLSVNNLYNNVGDNPAFVIPFKHNSFYLYPANESPVQLIVDYYDVPQILTDNSVTPYEISDSDMMVIVYRALISYAIYDEANEVLQMAITKDKYYTQRLHDTYGINVKPNRVRFNRW